MTASMRCISCGNAVLEPPKLHRLPDGSYCPACRERALDAIPAALPRDVEGEPAGEELYQGELFGDGDGDRAG